MPGPTVTAEPGVPEDVVAFLHHAAAVFATGSAEHIIAELFTEDAVVADHRPLFGTTSSGTEELRAYVRATFEVIPDFAISVHVLEARGPAYLARDTYGGHAAAGGGEAVMEWWVVDRLRDGRLEREDVYETEGEARAAFDAVTAR